MRISIRNQLALLVLFSVLVGVAVVSITTWETARPLYLTLRGTRWEAIATLKVDALTAVLQLMEREANALSTRKVLETSLTAYNQGQLSGADAASAIEADLNSALSGGESVLINLQAVLSPVSALIDGNSSDTVQVTAPGLTNRITLPWLQAGDNSTAFLGDAAGGGYPPSLYPNLTYSGGDNSTALADGTELDAESALLFGPFLINSSLSLFSITVPVLSDTAASGVLGWLTVVQNGSLITSILNSPIGLGITGTMLLVAADTTDNRLPSSLASAQTVTSMRPNITLRFVFPPSEGKYVPHRHTDHENGRNSTFPGDDFPIVQTALLFPNNETYGAGYDLNTYDEEGYNVGVGYALPSSNLCDWILVFETTKAEAYTLVTLMQKTLLACVFGTAGVAALLIYPLAHFSSRPIRRLRAATGRAANPVSFSGTSHTEDDSEERDYDVNTDEKRGFSSKVKAMARRHSPDVARDFDHARALNNVPQRVKDGKHYIEDELTDLTTTFNAMAEELAMQYSRLEERVRQRTAELELAKQSAESANESKSLFIANISHELKTPLAGIMGMTALCMQEDDLGKIKRSLGIIYKSGDLLHGLLSDLLTFSKHAMAKGLTLDEKEFRICELGTQVQAIFQSQVEQNEIDFSIAYEGPCDALGNACWQVPGEYGPGSAGKVRDMVLWGDSQRLLQIAINLISNALKFTPRRGTVRLSIRCAEQSTAESTPNSRISLSSRQPRQSTEGGATATGPAAAVRMSFASGDSEAMPTNPFALTYIYELAVQDTGPGVATDMQERIFQPFEQGDLKLTKRHGGTGLGLSICRQICELMKGTLTLQSALGVGSTFTLRVPLKLCRTRAYSVTTSSPQGSRRASRMASLEGATRALTVNEVDATRPELERSFEGDSRPHLIGLSQPFFSTGTAPMDSPMSPTFTDGGQSPTRRRILVAEDNTVNAEIVMRMLAMEETVDVTLAKDGQEAFDRVQASLTCGQPFHLILMDIMMPVLDGRQSTRLIRQAGCSSPIVALSAFTDDLNREECMNSGMDYFLSKPIKRPALKHVLKTYCSPIDEDQEPAGRVMGLGS